MKLSRRTLTIVLSAVVLGLLGFKAGHAMQDAGQTGFYDRDSTIGPQGGGGGEYNMKFTPNTRFLKGKKGSGKGGSTGNGTRADPTRGGAYD